jgi:hypothetical protein
MRERGLKQETRSSLSALAVESSRRRMDLLRNVSAETGMQTKEATDAYPLEQQVCHPGWQKLSAVTILRLTL